MRFRFAMFVCMVPVLLASCADDRQPSQTSVQACHYDKAAEIPVTLTRGFVSAPAVIEGQSVVLLIDTGAETSQIVPAALESLHLQNDPRRSTTIQGTGGSVTSRNVLLQSFGIGGMSMLDQSAAVAPLPLGQGAVEHVAGLLGADWLSSFDVDMDLPHDRIGLYRAHKCTGDDVPFAGRKTAVAARLQGAGLVLLGAKLDGQPVTALLDSGANASGITRAAAARVGTDEKVLAKDASGQSSGVDSAVIRRGGTGSACSSSVT